MRIVLLMTLVAVSAAGCVTNPEGSNWALADFNKYDRNYATFPVDRLAIGMPKAEVRSLFGDKLHRVSADAATETFVVERWVAVAGPDYVGERLMLRLDHDRLAGWKVDNGGTVTVVPRSW
jgi:hypothetical protein